MADHLREIKPGLATTKPPPEVRAALRAWHDGTANAEQQQRAYRYVVHELAGVHQIAFALPGEESVVNWRQGCRFVGLSIEAARMMPADDAPPPEPPAKTMTEKARRRARDSVNNPS